MASLAALAAAAAARWAWASADRRPLGEATGPGRHRRPVVRRTRFEGPVRRDVGGQRAPERSSATSRSKVSGVWAPTKRWLTCTHGARSQSARHSASSRVMTRPAVVPPASTAERSTRRARAVRRRRRAGRRCWCTPPPRACPPARCAACRRRRPCRAPRPGSRPTSSAMSTMASGVSQPSCSWARWQSGMSAERGSG